MGRMPPHERGRIYEKLVHESGRAAAEIGFWLFDRAGASKVDVEALTCPSLVVSGAEDRLTPASVVRRVAERYPGAATLGEFPGHAHWLIGEPGWERIAAYCADWLGEVLVRLPSRPVSRAAGNARPHALAGWGLPAFRKRQRSQEGRDRRVHERIDAAVEVEAAIPFSGNAQSYALGHTVNISRSGIFLDTDAPLEKGVHVNMGMRPGGPGRPLWVQARVVRSSGRGAALTISRGEMEELERILPLP
jgi:hypothetical protein